MRKPNCKCAWKRKDGKKIPCECWQKYYAWKAQHREYIRLGKALFHKRRKEFFEYADEAVRKEIHAHDNGMDDAFFEFNVVVKYKVFPKNGEKYSGQVVIASK